MDSQQFVRQNLQEQLRLILTPQAPMEAVINTPQPQLRIGIVTGQINLALFSLQNLLMEPNINSDLTHSVQPPEDLTLPLFRDIGWFPDENLNGMPDDQECETFCLPDTTIGTDPDRCDAVFNYEVTTTGICGDVTCNPPSGSVFPIGTTTVTCTSETGASCSFDVTVVDRQAPAISAASATPNMLWPPNHSMRNVSIAYAVADNCPDGACVLSVASDEPENGLGDGDTGPDWEILNANAVRLRCERVRTALLAPGDTVQLGWARITLAAVAEAAPGQAAPEQAQAAAPERIYRAFLDPDAMAKWLPPNGFTGKVHHMELKVGGTYKMSFTNFTTGKSHAFGGTYLELVPHERIRYTDRFDDPNLPGELQVTITLKQVSVGTEVTIVQEGVPEIIPPETCYLGWQQSLTLLANLVETEIPE